MVQSLKARSPILVTEPGIVISVRFSHHPKALFPISVTESGITIEVKLLQYIKAESPISVTGLSSIIVTIQ